jgi:CDP-glucose 4,6-dehydratase
MEDLVKMRKVDQSFWKGKRVFLTGHTGFKGSWLSLWLHSMGAVVKGYSLEPNTNPSLYSILNLDALITCEIGDIRDLSKVKESLVAFKPEIVIHMAAQPLVRYSYQEPIETYSTNVMGTVNVLEAIRLCDTVKAVVVVTTDKVYENKEWPWGYRENEPLGGYDPYSSSKACAELVTAAYRQSYFSTTDTPSVATARAGNVIGGGDWSLDRLIPDAIKAFEESKPLVIRNPSSIRPWQHVLEPLSGYLMLAESLFKESSRFAQSWNFGPDDDDCKTVKWILDGLVKIWGNDASWVLEQTAQPHEANFLKLDCSKAKTDLNWYPRWEISSVLEMIVNWHKCYKSGAVMKDLCLQEIKNYIQ